MNYLWNYFHTFINYETKISSLISFFFFSKMNFQRFFFAETWTCRFWWLPLPPSWASSRFQSWSRSGAYAKRNLTFKFTRAPIFVDTCSLFANCSARVKALSSFVIDPCTDLTVDTVAIVKPLVLTLFPCAIGMVIKKYCKGSTIRDGFQGFFFGDSQP